MANFTENDGRKFLLFYGPFRFRRTSETDLRKVLATWSQESLKTNISESACKKWIAAKKRSMYVPPAGILDFNRMIMWGYQSGCPLSTREIQLMGALVQSEYYMRALASGNSAGTQAGFDDVFSVVLVDFLEQVGEDPIENPRDELKGGDDADCLVVNCMKDYCQLVSQDQATWPSDALVEQLEIVGTCNASAGQSVAQTKFSHVAVFPGELRLVVDWGARSVSLDCILIDNDDQARICSATDPNEVGIILISSKQLRVSFSFDDVKTISKSQTLRFDDLPLRGSNVLSLQLSRLPEFNLRRLHSLENVSSRPLKRSAPPEQLQGSTECCITLSIPHEAGELVKGHTRNRKVVERLMQEINKKLSKRGSEGNPDRMVSAQASSNVGSTPRESRSAKEVLEELNVSGTGTDIFNHLVKPDTMPIRVHPNDTRKGLPPAIFVERPDVFVPRTNRYSGMSENWGLDDGSYEVDPMRQFEVQSLYSFGDREWSDLGPPELQYTRALLARKRSRMQAELESKRLLFSCDVVLRIALARKPTDDEELGAMVELNPSVWRRVIVSGGITLRSLHDRVLGPAMGWTRNYHGYFFVDSTDGSVFCGNSGAVDMMHSRFFFADALPDEHKLAELVSAVGDRLLYVYDLGDHWSHLITVEEIRPEADSSGRACVLDGAMACPPEDSAGLEGLGLWSYQKQVLQHDGRLPVALQREIGRANNVNATAFDAHAFDLSAAEGRVREACAGKASVAGGELSYHNPLFGVGAPSDFGCFLPQRKGVVVERTGEGAAAAGAQSVRPPERKDPRGERVCACCGSPHKLMLCSGCKSVAYCGPACQKEHWKAHKLQCRAAAAKKGAAKSGSK